LGAPIFRSSREHANKAEAFGVVPLFTDQSADGLSTLFAAWMRTWAPPSSVAASRKCCPARWCGVRLSRACHDRGGGGPAAVRPNPHAERFVKLLQEAARISPAAIELWLHAVDKQAASIAHGDDRGFLLRVAVIVKRCFFP